MSGGSSVPIGTGDGGSAAVSANAEKAAAWRNRAIGRKVYHMRLLPSLMKRVAVWAAINDCELPAATEALLEYALDALNFWKPEDENEPYNGGPPSLEVP